MLVDYIIVGQGLAGTVLAHTLEKQGAKLLVIHHPEAPSASRVAAGLYNPITGRRMSKTWKAEWLFPAMMEFYREFELQFSCSIMHDMPIYKPFSSIEEQNTWLSAHTGDVFVDTNLSKEKYQNFVNAPIGGFEVKQAGYLDIPLFLDYYKSHLVKQHSLWLESFDYSKVNVHRDVIAYKTVQAKKIIFCQGTSELSNPYFNWLPINPNKGELIEVEIQNFPENLVFSKKVFVIPLGNKRYRVGSTYEREFSNADPTEEGRIFLSDRLGELLKADFTVESQQAGIRPTVSDRKPILGLHPSIQFLGVFNGLGTKGVTQAPYFAKVFVDYLLHGKEIYAEANIERFYSLYSRV